jgi:hypothetical protein
MSVDVKMRRVNTFEYDRCRLKYVYSTGRKINKHKIYFFLILDIMHCEFESLTRLYTCYLYTDGTKHVVYVLYIRCTGYISKVCVFPGLNLLSMTLAQKACSPQHQEEERRGSPLDRASQMGRSSIVLDKRLGLSPTQHNQKSHRKTACNLQLDEANEPNASGD